MTRDVQCVRALAGFLACSAIAVSGTPALAAPQKPSTPCFFITQWQGWKAPNPKTIYLGVAWRSVYRLDLSSEVPQLMWPDMHLISIVNNPSTICTALDLRLSVTDNHAFRVPIIGRTLTKLTPEEVAAIPKKDLPNW